MNPDTLNGIIYYLISHQQRFKGQLNPFIEQRRDLLQDNSLFSDEINEQFRDIAIRTMTDDVTKALGVTTEEARTVLEDLNLDEYLA